MTGPAWIVVPTYNEAANLEVLVRGVRAAVPEARILVVDDDSPDGTGRLADGLAAADEHVEVLHRPGKAGLGLAYVNGFAHALRAGAGYVVEMDADLSHDPADLPRLIGRAQAGADLVLGSRYTAGGGVEDWDLLRRVLSRGGCRYARAVLGVGVRDLTGGFKCFRADTLRVDRLRDRALGGLRVPGRADLPGARARAARRGGPDHVPRPQRRRLEDVRADRARGDLAGPRAADRPPPRRPAGGPRLRGTGDPADPRGMKTEQLAVVQGWADTRGALRRWNARPATVLRPWALASLGVAVLLLAATWAVAMLSEPDPSGASFPGVTDRATLGSRTIVKTPSLLALKAT